MVGRSSIYTSGYVYLVIGLVSITCAPILYWFIHGDHDRYIWIINGPFPFSAMGGGPFQLWMYGSMILFGIFMCIVGIVNLFRTYRANKSPTLKKT